MYHRVFSQVTVRDADEYEPSKLALPLPFSASWQTQAQQSQHGVLAPLPAAQFGGGGGGSRTGKVRVVAFLFMANLIASSMSAVYTSVCVRGTLLKV